MPSKTSLPWLLIRLLLLASRVNTLHARAMTTGTSPSRASVAGAYQSAYQKKETHPTGVVKKRPVGQVSTGSPKNPTGAGKTAYLHGR
jgi:hypothetical protein